MNPKPCNDNFKVGDRVETKSPYEIYTGKIHYIDSFIHVIRDDNIQGSGIRVATQHINCWKARAWEINLIKRNYREIIEKRLKND